MWNNVFNHFLYLVNIRISININESFLYCFCFKMLYFMLSVVVESILQYDNLPLIMNLIMFKTIILSSSVHIWYYVICLLYYTIFFYHRNQLIQARLQQYNIMNHFIYFIMFYKWSVLNLTCVILIQHGTFFTFNYWFVTLNGKF